MRGCTASRTSLWRLGGAHVGSSFKELDVENSQSRGVPLRTLQSLGLDAQKLASFRCGPQLHGETELGENQQVSDNQTGHGEAGEIFLRDVTSPIFIAVWPEEKHVKGGSSGARESGCGWGTSRPSQSSCKILSP